MAVRPRLAKGLSLFFHNGNEGAPSLRFLQEREAMLLISSGSCADWTAPLLRLESSALYNLFVPLAKAQKSGEAGSGGDAKGLAVEQL